MNFNNEDEVLALFSRLLERLQQADGGHHNSSPTTFIYVAKGAQNVGSINIVHGSLRTLRDIVVTPNSTHVLRFFSSRLLAQDMYVMEQQRNRDKSNEFQQRG